MRTAALFILLLAALVMTGCSAKQSPLTDLLPDGKQKKERVIITDPAGPIQSPHLPPSLASAAAAQKKEKTSKKQKFPYTVTVEARPSLPGREEEAADPATMETEAGRVERSFASSSTLYRLQDKPPDSAAALEQRLSASLKEGDDVLRSLGFYAGKTRGRIVPAGSGNTQASMSEIRVRFFLGPQYHVALSPITAPLPPDAPDPEDKLPKTLADAGLPDNAPAVAADVLAAVDKSLSMFHNNGYPFAEVKDTRYIVDHEQRTLEAYVTIAPGAFVRMGDIARQGAPSVHEEYIRALQTWKPGRPWSRARVEAFRDALRQSGLFQSIEISPAEEPDKAGNRNIVTVLESAPERTVGGALKYHSDFGPGLQAFWEHRNLTGNGDHLRLSTPIWMDMQEFTAQYRLPFFLRKDQDFIAGAGAINQDVDAYRLTAATASAGIERRLSRRWSASVQGRVEGGSITEPDEDKQEYLMFGIPMTLTYDNTGSLLNAVKGGRFIFSTTPYTGEYHDSFTVLRSRVDGHLFIPLVGEDTVVLAARGSVGVVSGEKSADVPPSVRFYSGGGGSVRGYSYQSLGPRNDDNDPLGGGSLIETSVETRWKVADEWGVVAFVDGGTVYEDVFADTGETMRWGAGLGFRYYTAVGPVRFDVAVPLNPRKDDDDFQLYISIGQSF